MIFTPSWPPKWKKIGRAKKYKEYKERDVHTNTSKIKMSYLLPSSRGSNVMTFTLN